MTSALGIVVMLGLYIVAMLAAETAGCPLPCGSLCLEDVASSALACPGGTCAPLELALGDVCTGDGTTCGAADHCYVAAADAPTAAPSWTTEPARSAFRPRERRILFVFFVGFVAFALGLGIAVAAHALPLDRGRPRLPDLVDTFFEICRGEAGFVYWFREWRHGKKVPHVRVVMARHMCERDFRRVAPPPVLPDSLVNEI